jgi:hypothetical protein
LNLDFVPPDLDFVPFGLDFIPKNLDFVPENLEIRHPARARWPALCGVGGLRNGASLATTS